MQWAEHFRKLPSVARGLLGEYWVHRLPDSPTGHPGMSRIKRFLSSAANPTAERYAAFIMAHSVSERARILSRDFHAGAKPQSSNEMVDAVFNSHDADSLLHYLLLCDMQLYLPGDLLMLTDRVSMLHSLEVRVPFLDHPLIELMAQIPASKNWGLLLEYPIPRRQKRIDGVVLADELIFVLEFKVGADTYEPLARRQAEDYSLDLRDFHERSLGHVVIPVLVATDAPDKPNSDALSSDELVRAVRFANSANLAHVVKEAHEVFHCGTRPVISLAGWNTSGYKPVPTIIEAAEALFAGQSVREISSSHADVFNLTRTASKLVQTVGWAQANNRKVICFVTGVPGAGKTLAGLTVTHDPLLRSDDRPAGVFLSGNGPLVRIVRAALARDSKRRTGLSVSESKRTSALL